MQIEQIVKHKGSPQVYIISEGKKYPIQGIEEFNALGLDWGQVKEVESSWLNGINLGSYITPSNIQDWVSKFGVGKTQTSTQSTTQPYQAPDEATKYLGEAQAYYEPRRVEEMQEIERDVATQKQRLQEDWQNYLQDLETGKLRAGTDQQQQLERALQQKTEYLTQQEFNIKQNMEALNRSWIQRGGLFSGARLQAGQQYMTEEDMARQRYMSQWGYGQEQQQTAYTRSMEDYQTAQMKGQLTLTRGEEDVALKRIKDIRTLSEKYNLAIGTYAGKQGYDVWQQKVYGAPKTFYPI